MLNLKELILWRRSVRGAFDPDYRIDADDLEAVLRAACWAPTAHNMQNFEIVVVDDPAMLETIGRVTCRVDAAFLRENFDQLSFSEEALRNRRSGILAGMFPETWRSAGPDFDAAAAEFGAVPLSRSLQGAPCLMLVLHDTRRRAPASENDALGLISLGCVLENIWLTAEACGLAMQVLSVFSNPEVEQEVRSLLAIPPHLKTAYACRLGYPLEPYDQVRVRRDIEDFSHRNRYGTPIRA